MGPQFIQLTDEDGDPILVNTMQIQCIEIYVGPQDASSGHELQAMVRLERESIAVEESLDDIATLLIVSRVQRTAGTEG